MLSLSDNWKTTMVEKFYVEHSPHWILCDVGAKTFSVYDPEELELSLFFESKWDIEKIDSATQRILKLENHGSNFHTKDVLELLDRK